MTKQIITCTLILFTLVVYSQNNIYQSLIIDEKYTRNANSCIREESTLIEVESEKNVVTEYKKVITVFNEYGNRDIDAVVHYDNNVSVNKLEAIIYDQLGNEIKKIKKKDFRDVSAVDGGTLYSDSRFYFLEYKPLNYPYTVEFTYKTKNKNSAFMPPWQPISNYYQSVAKSEFIVRDLDESGLRTLEKNLDFQDNISVEKKENEIICKAQNLTAVVKENYSPSLASFTPIVHFALSRFYLEGVKGEASNWSELGKWQYEELIKDRDEISEQTKSEVLALTEGVEDTLEKVRLIYEYVQNKTRYISVQVGIGGWQPISAEEVDKVLYGDCKGLTNYTKALLKIVGIESNYTIVFAGNEKRDIESEFASMQGNHVILNVPTEEKDLWLECTSQDIPFGFLGDFTDDRNVLVVNENGGEIKRTDAYFARNNYQKLTGDMVISASGDLKADFKISSYGTQYDNKYKLEKKSVKNINKFYKSYYGHLKDLVIDSYNFENNKREVKFTENLMISARRYANKFGNRIMLTANALNQSIGIPDKYENRQTPFVVNRGFYDEDTLNIKLPKGYTIESMPESKNISTEFGEYTVNFSLLENGDIQYTRNMLLKNGDYSKDDYSKFRAFFIEVNKADQSKIILVKKT